MKIYNANRKYGIYKKNIENMEYIRKLKYKYHIKKNMCILQIWKYTGILETNAAMFDAALAGGNETFFGCYHQLFSGCIFIFAYFLHKLI